MPPLEPAKPQAVGDHEHGAEGHGGAGDDERGAGGAVPADEDRRPARGVGCLLGPLKLGRPGESALPDQSEPTHGLGSVHDAAYAESSRILEVVHSGQ
jgi:hypothetical protein